MDRKKKLVPRQHIAYVADELQNMKILIPSHLSERFESLCKYYEDNIYQKEQDEKNELKRTLYRKKNEATTSEEKGTYLDFYKQVDKMYDKKK